MKDILIYNDTGVGKDSLKFTKKAFKKYGGVKLVNSTQIIAGDIPCDFLVFPGGADIPYCKKLNGPGCDVIKNFVANGGVFFGICAGAYFGSNFVEFAKENEKLEVVGARELGFFPGNAIGPMYDGFAYGSYAGAKVVNLSTAIGGSKVFFNGGCYFEDAAKYQDVKVLAHYDTGEAAVVSCQYGKGKAILSGVHYEFPIDAQLNSIE